MHIAVDMDGVLLDMVGGLCTAVGKEYGVGLTPADVELYDLHPLLDPILGRSWWDWLRDRDWLWSNFTAIDGAIGAVDKLRRDGHYIEVVTAKPEWAEHTVWKWLGKWRPAVHQVTIVEVGEPKHLATDAELLIDDHPGNCTGFVDSDPLQRRALLFAAAYNASELDHRGVIRVDHWQHALNVIDLLKDDA